MEAEPVSTSGLLRNQPMFARLDAQSIAELEEQLVLFALPGGATLFDEGDPSDALYLLRSGSLGVFRRDVDGRPVRIGLIAAGEVVGELGPLIDTPRTASVRALRDSELLALSRAAFEVLIGRHPQAMLSMVRVALTRLASTAPPAQQSPRTFAIFAQQRGVDVRGFAARLATALGNAEDCELVDAATGGHHTSEWFSALELRARHVLYLDTGDDAQWRKLCLRQADALLMVVNADDSAAPWPVALNGTDEQALHRPCHLVLLHAGEVLAGAARRALVHGTDVQHHHVRAMRTGDIERIARILTGTSLNLVLSGGGARGFAQIGVVRALRENGHPIDSVGGTSIGAIIGAGIANDWSDQQLVETFRRYFVIARPVSDYTLPLVALTRGRRTAGMLREAFGELDIEDLVLPFFCCSVNLTRNVLAVHRRGVLWHWLRASCAIPGILPPVLRSGEVHVDGAVMNNLPVDVMRAAMPGAIVACNIATDDLPRSATDEYQLPSVWRVLVDRWRRGTRPGIVSILVRSGMVNSEATSLQGEAIADLVIAPPVESIGLLDWRSFERTIEIGYQHACEVLAADSVKLPTRVEIV